MLVQTIRDESKQPQDHVWLTTQRTCDGANGASPDRRTCPSGSRAGGRPHHGCGRTLASLLAAAISCGWSTGMPSFRANRVE